ncbi:tetratricopeptide repeat protein [Gigaspora margarita]|uniref:Tetratricopeptide repeat protein n=1 Tax=Gigaspora margarita TaxID=4874 RepID=A0A8H4EI96_GIGMA|nr:tetratricopeptide repeat protein [Gigaspora margarita]
MEENHEFDEQNFLIIADSDLRDVLDTSTCSTPLHIHATGENNNDLDNVHEYTSSEYELRGLDYIDQGQYDRSIEYFSNALKIEPNRASSLIYRGLVYNFLNRHEDAVTDSTKALVIQPQNPQALFIRGQAYLSLSRQEESFKDFNGILEMEPNKI